MKILITGGSSLLGRALIKSAQKDYEIESTWYSNYVDHPMYQMDVTNKSQVRYVFDRVKPECVIHCAANGSVDFAEANYQEAYQVNVTGTENILWAAKEYWAKVIYISTNAVFSGEQPPYNEDSPRQPVNRYGSIKAQAEDVIRDYPNWLIVRPFLLYGWPWPGGRPNWATLVIDKLSQGQELKLVDDVIWQPTYVIDCAKAIYQLMINSTNEIYNIAGEEKLSLYQFGLKTAREFSLDENLIKPVDSNYFTSIAKRPINTSFDSSKASAAGLKFDNIEAGLRRMRRNQ